MLQIEGHKYLFDQKKKRKFSLKHDQYEKYRKYSLKHDRTGHVAVTEVNAVGHRFNLVRIIPVKIISNEDDMGEVNQG